MSRRHLRPPAGHVVPVVVGAEVALKLELLLVLGDREPDGARRRPLEQIALRQRKRFPPLLDVLIE
jgi:hypothetical protein